MADRYLHGSTEITGDLTITKSTGLTTLAVGSGSSAGYDKVNIGGSSLLLEGMPNEGKITAPNGYIYIDSATTNGQVVIDGTPIPKYELLATSTDLAGKVDKLTTTGVKVYSHNGSTQGELAVGAASGVASLDSNAKIPLSQLPDVILGQLVYGGTVTGAGVATLSTNAKTKLGTTSSSITLVNSAGTKTSVTGWVANEGIFYIASSDGTFASLDLKVGDWLISTGSAWNKVDNTDAVTGVKGNAESSYRIGNVNITCANIGAAESGHTHTTSIATDSGTNQLSLAANTKYKLSAGDTSFIFTTPTDTHYTNYLQIKGNGTEAIKFTQNSDKILNFAGSGATSVSGASGTITISSTDTKNTAGSTDTSSKIFLVGATSQAANPQTYSDNEIYATSGVLTTKSVQVGGSTGCTLEYSNEAVKFIFA